MLSQVQEEAAIANNVADHRLRRWNAAVQERNVANDQLAARTRQRDELVDQLAAMTLQRDQAVHAAEGWYHQRENDRVRALEYQAYLNDRLEQEMIENHRLHNIIDPIPVPIPVYPVIEPQVIVADDDGMDADGPGVAAPAPQAPADGDDDEEEEESEPVSDGEDGAVYYPDSDNE
jgi:hypothetical protein